jgi:glycosyltransferase involved in cell wall biosynthesis
VGTRVTAMPLPKPTPRKRVLIDGYLLNRTNGFGRYARELLVALGRQQTDFDICVAVPQPVDRQLAEKTPHLSYRQLPNVPMPLWEQVVMPFFALGSGADIVHFPYNTRCVATLRFKTVTTVHDLTFLDREAERDFRSALIHIYVGGAFHLGSAHSDRIISVSNTTQKALLTRGLSSERIYNTVDSFINIRPPASSPRPTRPYFLHRGGTSAGHRNTPRLIEAFLGTPALREACDLRILGLPDGAARWNIAADDPVHFLPRVSDEALALLYAQSTAVVAPSIREGFCLPIVEGFGFSVPVITSDIDPMREIAGGAALLVSPDSTDDLAAAMLRVLQDRELAEELVRKGGRRLAAFSSETMGSRLVDLYRDMLTPSPHHSRDGKLALER